MRRHRRNRRSRIWSPAGSAAPMSPPMLPAAASQAARSSADRMAQTRSTTAGSSFQALILRLQQYWADEGCVILQPAPADSQELYLKSLAALGIDAARHDIRFVEDDWESPTLGAWGLGWEVWLDGMEVSQFTYFQQVGGIECDPVSTELTYGLERLAMYVQGVESVYDLDFNGGTGDRRITYGEVFKRAEREFSVYNFEAADTSRLFAHFADAETECQGLIARGIALPAYDQCLKASHLFNLLDARGVISVTERAAYIGRVRALARASCETWLAGGDAGRNS